MNKKGDEEEEYIPYQAVREETVGASLGAGGMEVASELWTERVFVAQVDSNGASPLSRKAMIGQVEFDSAMSRQRQSARFFANAGGITDFAWSSSP